MALLFPPANRDKRSHLILHSGRIAFFLYIFILLMRKIVVL